MRSSSSWWPPSPSRSSPWRATRCRQRSTRCRPASFTWATTRRRWITSAPSDTSASPPPRRNRFLQQPADLEASNLLARLPVLPLLFPLLRHRDRGGPPRRGDRERLAGHARGHLLPAPGHLPLRPLLVRGAPPAQPADPFPGPTRHLIGPCRPGADGRSGLIQALDDGGDAHPVTDAHRGQAVAGALALQLVEQSRA